MTNPKIEATLWLIPARGGSKGIPDKNIKKLCGKSPVARAVEQALSCAKEGNDTVFVSTDSSAIKEEAERCGVEVPFLRDEKYATDTASTYDVIIHTLEEFKKRGKTFEKVVLLQPTSPLRSEEDIRNTLSKWNRGVEMAVSVTSAKTNPYYNGFEQGADGFLHISKGPGNYTRRQDAPEVWEYNGAVYVMSVEALEQRPYWEFKKIVAAPMPQERSLDLDTPIDWLIAETILNQIQKV